jgi:hypothetical protein
MLFDSGEQFVERQVGEKRVAFRSVVAVSRGELILEPHGIHHADLFDEDGEGLLRHLA